ncbi:MAG TPA: hypothetical protein H9867_04510 [Candidatus Corynebacterium gallistercoris]|uniref:Uncharacterized protein n=1 Tax=Candidatus Corynebacterium gallistercoris TaxID=2838530 RepID=A0A9D1UQY4_9CORY|nr:hypothetical protein [Candidatus Corynebacterium gallistercoris]
MTSRTSTTRLWLAVFLAWLLATAARVVFPGFAWVTVALAVAVFFIFWGRRHHLSTIAPIITGLTALNVAAFLVARSFNVFSHGVHTDLLLSSPQGWFRGTVVQFLSNEQFSRLMGPSLFGIALSWVLFMAAAWLGGYLSTRNQPLQRTAWAPPRLTVVVISGSIAIGAVFLMFGRTWGLESYLVTNAGMAWTAMTVALIAAAAMRGGGTGADWGLAVSTWGLIIAVFYSMANRVGIARGAADPEVDHFDPLAYIGTNDAAQYISAEQSQHLLHQSPDSTTTVAVVYLSAAGCAALVTVLAQRVLRSSATLSAWVGALASVLLATIAMEAVYMLFVGSLPLLLVVHSGIFAVTVAAATLVVRPTSSGS